MKYRSKTLKSFLNSLELHGDNIFARYKYNNKDYRNYTYKELYLNAKAVASYLDRMHWAGKGDRFALWSENRPEWFMIYFGIVYNGAWAVPMDAKLTETEIKNLLDDCKPKAFFISRTLFDSLSDPEYFFKHVSEVIVIDDEKKDELTETKKIKKFSTILNEGYKIPLKEKDVKENYIASLIYTSGTTGKPKGVLLSHLNFYSQILGLKDAVEVYSTDVVLSVLPLHHTFEFSAELRILEAGASITYAESLKPNKMFANIKETGVTILIGVPLLFEKIYEGIIKKIEELPVGVKHLIKFWFLMTSALNVVTDKKAGKSNFAFLRRKAGLDKIRFVISGAAPLNYKVGKGFETLGITLINGYGLTEFSPVVSVNRLDRKIKNESVGLPLYNAEVKIDNPDEKGMGEILVRGPSVMHGYYKNWKATKEVIDKDGWLHTGDIGKLDSEGYLYITGRKKNIIVTPGGKNVYPEEIEDMLNSSPFVLESLVIGIPESEHSKGENIFAYVVPNLDYFENYCSINNHKLTDEFINKTIEEHIKNVSSKLQDYKKIKGYKIRFEEFEKTSTKKIKRYLFTGKEMHGLM